MPVEMDPLSRHAAIILMEQAPAGSTTNQERPSLPLKTAAMMGRGHAAGIWVRPPHQARWSEVQLPFQMSCRLLL